MNNSTIRKMYNLFSSIPGFWELDSWIGRATANSPYRAQLIETLGLGVSSRVLDVACGTGLNFELLQKSLDAKGLLAGIDQSGKSLALAQKMVRNRGWENVKLVEADCAAYKPEEPFDAALCTFAIDIIPPWRETIDMMVNAIRPEGKIGFIGFKESSRNKYKMFNSLWRKTGIVFGGVELGRPVREYLSQQCNEILYKEVHGGFYYILVGSKK